MCEQDRLKVSKQIRDEVLNETGVYVSARTIHSRLVEKDLFGRVAKKRPMLSNYDRNIARRLTWTEKHRHWTKEKCEVL